jgi:hypothetical protein
MLSVGMKNASLVNYVDGYAVAQVLVIPTYSTILNTTSFKFPLLTVNQTGATPVSLSSVKAAVKRDFLVSWIMPPMETSQLFVLQAWQSIIAKTWLAFAVQGYDPKLANASAGSVWQQLGLVGGEIGQISFKPFSGSYFVDGAAKEAVFPTVSMKLSFVEVNQLGLPQNYPHNFDSASISLSITDGYNPNNPLFFADGYADPNLSVVSFTPTSGSHSGDTLVFITGNGFDVNKSYTVSFNGAFSQNVFVRSVNIIQALTPPSINAQTGSGDIVVSDYFGNTVTISGWDYT